MASGPAGQRASGLALEPGLALRVFASLAFGMTMINAVLNVVGNLQRALVAQTLTDPLIDSLIDPLTGAYNRRHMAAQLGQCVASAEAGPPVEVLLMFDIDRHAGPGPAACRGIAAAAGPG